MTNSRLINAIMQKVHFVVDPKWEMEQVDIHNCYADSITLSVVNTLMQSYGVSNIKMYQIPDADLGYDYVYVVNAWLEYFDKPVAFIVNLVSVDKHEGISATFSQGTFTFFLKNAVTNSGERRYWFGAIVPSTEIYSKCCSYRNFSERMQDMIPQEMMKVLTAHPDQVLLQNETSIQYSRNLFHAAYCISDRSDDVRWTDEDGTINCIKSNIFLDVGKDMYVVVNTHCSWKDNGKKIAKDLSLGLYDIGVMERYKVGYDIKYPKRVLADKAFENNSVVTKGNIGV